MLIIQRRRSFDPREQTITTKMTVAARVVWLVSPAMDPLLLTTTATLGGGGGAGAGEGRAGDAADGIGIGIGGVGVGGVAGSPGRHGLRRRTTTTNGGAPTTSSS